MTSCRRAEPVRLSRPVTNALQGANVRDQAKPALVVTTGLKDDPRASRETTSTHLASRSADGA